MLLVPEEEEEEEEIFLPNFFVLRCTEPPFICIFVCIPTNVKQL
jgi:hypothetical protein